MSINPNAKFPDTKYSKFLGILPPVPTVFGLQLVFTNTLNITLDFPAGAVSAGAVLGAGKEASAWRMISVTVASGIAVVSMTRW